MYGTDDGTRSCQSTRQRLAAYDSISSTARGSTECRPRSVLIATGKKVRYAARIATAFQPATPFEPRPTTTIGAIARIGTVCDATMYGRMPRSSRRDCESTTASAKPIAAPSRKPASASLPVNHAACEQRVDQRRAAGGRRLPERGERCRGGAASSCRRRRTATSSRSSPRATCSPPRGPREPRRRAPSTPTRRAIAAARLSCVAAAPASITVSDYHNAKCVVFSPRAARPVTHGRRARGAASADRRRRRRPARRVDGHLGAGARVPAGEGANRPARSRRSTRPATSGSRSRAHPSACSLIGGHMDSVPNGGWLDGCLNVLAGRRGAAPDRRGGRRRRSRCGSSPGPTRRARASAARCSARRRRRARCATRTSCARSPTATGSRCRTRCASTASTSTARSTRARSSRARRRISSCTSSRGRCSSRSTCRSASCSARSASSARGSPGAARLRTPARRRWTSGATRSPGRRSSRSTSARSRARSAAARSARRAASSTRPGIVTSVVETAEQLLDQRHLDATPLARMLQLAQRRGGALRRRGEHRGRVGADLEHRADPVRRGR